MTLAVFCLAVLTGGSNFVAIRFSNDGLAPLWGAGLRFAAAAVLIMATAAALKIPLPRGVGLVGAAGLGVLTFSGNALLYWGLLEAPAALAAAVVSLVPLMTLAMSSLLRIETFSWRNIAGSAVAIAGTILVFGDQLRASVSVLTLAALIGAALCVAGWTVFAKSLPGMHPVTTTGVALVPTAALLLSLSVVLHEPRIVPASAVTWVALAYLAASSCAASVGTLFVVRRWGASASSYSTVLFAPVAVALGALFAGEFVSAEFLLGVCLVIAGTYIGALS